MNPGFENLGTRWRQIRFNPLRSLTPERLAAALDSSAAGWLRDAAMIYEAIEQREAIVRSVMTKRKSAVARRDWQIIVPDPDDPNAESHKETLEYFYSNLTCTDATDLNVRTGMSGLLRQMMDSVIQRYAAHEIVWQPSPEGLTAELRRVPLYFFENRSGRLRFVGPENRADGVPLEDGGWMITVHDGLGEALSICYMYKRLGVQDWVAFSEKFSIPGVMGRTSAKSDSDEGRAMAASVAAYASEWVGVVYGDDGSVKDPISVIQTPSGASLPQKELVEYMDRMIATLVRGGDLSTISNKDGVGSNPQDDETDALLADDCQLVTETLNTQIDRMVIRMVHGDEKPAAYISIRPPDNEDLEMQLRIDQGLSTLGVKQDPEDLAERYGREIAEENTELENYNPNQARHPAGSKDGGKFSSEGGEQTPHSAAVHEVNESPGLDGVSKIITSKSKDGVGEVVGVARNGKITIVRAWVDEDQRGKGIGTSLYRGLVNYARENRMELHSDQTVEKGAVKVWESLQKEGLNIIKDETAGELDDGTLYSVTDRSIFRLIPNEAVADAILAALSADLQPLGEALAAAMAAGDEAAMKAALRKISKDMPDFLESAALADAIGYELLTALTDTDEKD